MRGVKGGQLGAAFVGIETMPEASALLFFLGAIFYQLRRTTAICKRQGIVLRLDGLHQARRRERRAHGKGAQSQVVKVNRENGENRGYLAGWVTKVGVNGTSLLPSSTVDQQNRRDSPNPTSNLQLGQDAGHCSAASGVGCRCGVRDVRGTTR